MGHPRKGQIPSTRPPSQAGTAENAGGGQPGQRHTLSQEEWRERENAGTRGFHRPPGHRGGGQLLNEGGRKGPEHTVGRWLGQRAPSGGGGGLQTEGSGSGGRGRGVHFSGRRKGLGCLPDSILQAAGWRVFRGKANPSPSRMV